LLGSGAGAPLPPAALQARAGAPLRMPAAERRRTAAAAGGGHSLIPCTLCPAPALCHYLGRAAVASPWASGVPWTWCVHRTFVCEDAVTAACCLHDMCTTFSFSLLFLSCSIPTNAIQHSSASSSCLGFCTGFWRRRRRHLPAIRDDARAGWNVYLSLYVWTSDGAATDDGAFVLLRCVVRGWLHFAALAPAFFYSPSCVIRARAMPFLTCHHHADSPPFTPSPLFSLCGRTSSLRTCGTHLFLSLHSSAITFLVDVTSALRYVSLFSSSILAGDRRD